VLSGAISASWRDDTFGRARVNPRRSSDISEDSSASPVGLCKIFFYFEAFVHESSIRGLSPHICIARTIAILLHVYCAICDAPFDLPFVCHTPYIIGNDRVRVHPSSDISEDSGASP